MLFSQHAMRIFTPFFKRAFRLAQDDVWRATEALAAIPGRFDRLLTCAQLSHTRSTRGSAVKCRNLPMKDLILTLVT